MRTGSCLRVGGLVADTSAFLSDPGKPGVRSLGPDVRPSLTETPFVDLTDVTLTDEDSNSIPTDDVIGQSRAMWQCKWRHLVANIETNAS